MRLNNTVWRAIGEERDTFLAFLESVFVMDSLKALLLNRRFTEILAFTADLAAVCSPSAARFGTEATIIAACRLGDFDKASMTAASAAQEERGWLRAVFRLRLAEVHACAGEPEKAGGVLLPLVDVLRRVSRETWRELQSLHVLHRIAGACAEADLAEAAYDLAREVYTGARAADDEVLAIESLRILAATAPAGGCGTWQEALTELEETTEYARYRRGGPLPPNLVIQGLYEQLNEVFSN